jgi:hypothetical protein
MHPAWRTSSRSSNGEQCVEVAPTTNGVLVRHSKRPGDGTIAFTFPAWEEFLRAALSGQSPNIRPDGTDTLVSALHTGVELRFDKDEWQAFVAGVRDREFDPEMLTEHTDHGQMAASRSPSTTIQP